MLRMRNRAVFSSIFLQTISIIYKAKKLNKTLGHTACVQKIFTISLPLLLALIARFENKSAKILARYQFISRKFIFKITGVGVFKKISFSFRMKTSRV